MRGPDTLKRAFTFFNIDFPIVKAVCRMPENRVKVHLESHILHLSSPDSSVLAMPAIRLTFNQDSQQPAEDDASGLALQEARPQLRRPPMYKVVLFNDDYTPMDFVIHVLERFFQKNREDATRIMLHVHNHGVGECGIYTYEVAETKVTQVMDFARQHQHPLQCVMEKK